MLKAVIATIATVSVLLAYAVIVYLRVQQYMQHGWEMPLSFRVQVGISAFIFRFWWVCALLFAPVWSIVFFITHWFNRDKASAASLS
jgi:hypothetical protein